MTGMEMKMAGAWGWCGHRNGIGIGMMWAWGWHGDGPGMGTVWAKAQGYHGSRDGMGLVWDIRAVMHKDVNANSVGMGWAQGQGWHGDRDSWTERRHCWELAQLAQAWSHPGPGTALWAPATHFQLAKNCLKKGVSRP